MKRTEVEDRGLHAIVCHDDLPPAGSSLADDVVLGPGGAALTLLRMTPRMQVSSVWDLGTGCGVQAVFAAQHASRVTATDISERALTLAAESAKANGLELDLRLGSLAEPVAGEHFDLIVSNPPFVIGGASALLHRESPFEGDGLARELLRVIPDHLSTDGIAVMLCAWLETLEETWEERIEQWLPAEHDVWVGLRELLDVSTYIDVWASDAGRGDDEQLRSSWLRRMTELGAERVAFGWIVLRQTDSEPAVRIEDVRNAAATPTGEQVLERLSAARLADELSAVEMLSSQFEVASTQTWRGEVSLDPLLFALRERLAHTRSLPSAVSELSADLNLDEDDLMVHALAGVKQLLDHGLLARLD